MVMWMFRETHLLFTDILHSITIQRGERIKELSVTLTPLLSMIQ